MLGKTLVNADLGNFKTTEILLKGSSIFRLQKMFLVNVLGEVSTELQKAC
jgi:hypothetical protein